MIDFKFTCPHCCEPWARTTGNIVDIHGGSVYECADCGGLVEFDVRKADVEVAVSKECLRE